MLVNYPIPYLFSPLVERVFLFFPLRAWGRGEVYESAVLCNARIKVEILENLVGAREAASGS